MMLRSRSPVACNFLHVEVRAQLMNIYFFFFFFQAEDGIRDDLVTGVQTCALPIYIVATTVIAARTTSKNESSFRRSLLAILDEYDFVPLWIEADFIHEDSHQPQEIGRASCRERV